MTTSAVIAGIDPGTEGGLCLLYRDSGTGAWVCTAEPLPYFHGEVDTDTLVRLLTGCRGIGLTTVYIEKQHCRPKDGKRQIWTMAANYSAMLTALKCGGIPFVIVAPQTWKGVVLRDTAKDKAAAIAYVARRFPSVDLKPGRRIKPHDGMADAVCIAVYGATSETSREPRRPTDPPALPPVFA